MCDMVPSVQKKLFQHVDEHIAFYVGAWKQLYAQVSNTVHYRDSQKILEGVITQLQQRGIQAQVLSERMPLLYAELPAGVGRTILFYSRYDTHAPRVQELEEIAALLSAFEVCKQVSGLVPVNIKWLLDGSGKDNPELSRSLEEHSDLLQADACLWSYAGETGVGEDGAPILAIGTKGRLSVELEVQTGGIAIDAMHGAIAPNALWRLLWALNSLKDAHEDVKIEGFYDTVTPAQDNSIAALYTLPENAHDLAQHWDLQRLVMDLKGFQLHYTHLLLPTCTVTGITSSTPMGDSVSTIPTQAKAQVDFRLVPDQEPADIFAKLQQHLQSQGFQDVRARLLYAQRSTITPGENPFVQRVTRATEKAYGQAPYLLPITVGSYALAPLRTRSGMPIVLTARGEQAGERPGDSFAAMIKQIALIIEETAYATDTTQ